MSKFQFFGVMNFKNCIYISWKIQILTILQHKITQIFTKNYYLLSKFSKLHNLETYFCELLRPRAPPFQKNQMKSLKLGHHIAKILLFRTPNLWNSTTELILIHMYILIPRSSNRPASKSKVSNIFLL